MFNTTTTHHYNVIHPVIKKFIRPRFRLYIYKYYRMSVSRTRSRQDKEDGNYDAIANTVTYLTILSAFFTSLTSANTTAVYNATNYQPTLGITKTHYSVIDPYGTRLMNMNTK